MLSRPRAVAGRFVRSPWDMSASRRTTAVAVKPVWFRRLATHSLKEAGSRVHQVSLRVKVVSENGFRLPGEPLFSAALVSRPGNLSIKSGDGQGPKA
jgi:hypothetical protein